MLKVENIKKEFASGDQIVKAVDGVNLNVPTGTFSVIVGKSGSGKSTLLSLLGALDKPTFGKIEVDDEDVTKLNDRKLSLYRCKKIGFVFQGYNLIPNLTALENVMLPMEFAGKGLERSKKRAEKLLAEVGITDQKQNRKPSRLSGGEQQRVAIARSLANQPKLILADEPTGNLDSKTGKLIVDLLRKLAKDEKTTIVAVTHDDSIAKLADVTFTLKDGKLSK
ncbi:MAG: ABC transporter ATP-binding protein [Patescibacteria group bacterium]|nr:ABC transporter ATP-binding protein [Patescibacteria group bacterium]